MCLCLLSLTLQLIRLMWISIGGRQHINACKAFFIKSNSGSRETSHTIKSRCACVCTSEMDIWWLMKVKANSTLLNETLISLLNL
jgi:hypothetical protein